MTDLHLVKPPPYDREADSPFEEHAVCPGAPCDCAKPMFECGYCGAPAGEPCRNHETFEPAIGVLIGAVIGVVIGLTLISLWVLL